MLYNPNDVDLVEKLSVYGEFNRDDFGVDKVKLFRYIILVYDLNSPMRTHYIDLWERKRAVAILVGFKTTKGGKFSSDEEAIFVGENMAVNEAITKYVMLHGIPEYTALIAFQTGLHFEMLKVQKGVISQAITKNINLLKDNIRSLTDYLFGGDESLNVRRMLYATVEKDRFPLPDDVVRRINSGDMLDDYNPYGEYSVDELKYIGDE
jgi:hypothetical protein